MINRNVEGDRGSHPNKFYDTLFLALNVLIEDSLEYLNSIKILNFSITSIIHLSGCGFHFYWVIVTD